MFSCRVTSFIPEISFSVDGISSLIEKVKLSSASGLDEINAKLLKNIGHVASAYFVLIFSQSLSTGIIPDDWKVGKVVPIFKSGNKNSPLNYQPISLTSIPCKLMEHVIYSYIINFLDSQNFFHHSQHGFRRGLSCETQLAIYVHDLHANLDVNVQTDSLFLDFAKAFDKVPHKRLILKLSFLNLHPNVLNWIKEFLTNRSQVVFTNNKLSSPLPVSSGVPQGSVLGPLLFLIYINDLPLHVSSNIRMFADDCVIYRTVTSPSDHTILQQDLDHIVKWCDDWLMSLNPTKCKLISFTRRQFTFHFTYNIANVPVESVTTYKYLGVTLSNNMSWNTHIAKVTSSANRTLGFLKRHLRNAPSHAKLLAYKSLVMAKLEYASPIWNPPEVGLTNTLESVQNRAARFIHASYSYEISASFLKAECILSPLSCRRRIATLSLFHKFFHSPLNCPPYIIPAAHISHRTGHALQVSRPRARTKTFSASFFPRAAKDWNGLSRNIATITCPSSFMHSISDLSSH